MFWFLGLGVQGVFVFRVWILGLEVCGFFVWVWGCGLLFVFRDWLVILVFGFMVCVFNL